MLKKIKSHFLNHQGTKPTLTVDTTKPLLLIDLDGTLVNAKKIHGEVIQKQYLKRFNVKVNPTHWYALFGLGDRLEHATLMKQYRISHHDQLIETVCQEYAKLFEGTIKNLNAKKKKNLIIPHALRFLREMKRRHIPMAIVTGNVRKTAFAMLKHLGLAQFFITGGFGDDPGVWDRSDILKNALNRCRQKGINLPTQRTIVIGDTPHDAHAAHEVDPRMNTLLVATGDYSLARLKKTRRTKNQPRLVGTDFALNNLSEAKEHLHNATSSHTPHSSLPL